MLCPCPGPSHAPLARIHALGSSLGTTPRRPPLCPCQPPSPASPMPRRHAAPQHPMLSGSPCPAWLQPGRQGASKGGDHGLRQKRPHPTSHHGEARGDAFPAMSLSRRHPGAGWGQKKGVSASTDLRWVRMTKGRVPSPLTEALSHLHPISPGFWATKKKIKDQTRSPTASDGVSAEGSG